MDSKFETSVVNSGIWKALKKSSFYIFYYKKLKPSVNNYRRKRQAKRLQKYGWQITDDIFEIAERSGLEITAAYGTLLGFVREKGFIKHDYDLDFGIVIDCESDFKKLESELVMKGYKKERDILLNNQILVEQTYNKFGIDIDFFAYLPDADSYKTFCFVPNPSFESKKFNAKCWTIDGVRDIKKVNIHGHSILVPQNYIDNLTLFYGANWRIPDSDFKSLKDILKDGTYGKEYSYKT